MDILEGLNRQQREAVEHVEGPLLVLAGAGSGKTRVITRRVAYMVSLGVDPRAILAITFTNKAAGEMKERVVALGTPEGATVCTFHAICARLLREFADAAGLARDYSIYDRNDQLKVTKEALREAEKGGSFLTPSTAHAAISAAKNELLTPDAYAEKNIDFYGRNCAAVYALYDKIMQRNRALDFDDLLMRTAFLFRDRPDIREYLGTRFTYVLIDEYQDTNRAQYIIAHAVALDHGNLCVTGDPDQSIYGWRGADINNILNFEKDYPAARVIRLEENYRSTRPILRAASRLIEHNTIRKGKSLFTSRDGGTDVRVVAVDDGRAEAREICDRIERYGGAGISPKDVAVFYRLNSISRVLEEEFIRRGIPYRIARGVEFYNRKEIKDLLAYLKLMANPADDISCERIINTPPRGIGKKTLTTLKHFAAAEGIGLLAACARAGEAGTGARGAKQAGAFARLMSSLATDRDRPVGAVVEEVYRRSGLEKSHAPEDEDSLEARANVDELISTAVEFDEDEGREGGLPEYLHGISLVADVDHFNGESGAVTMMTLHAAKGLEFPVVFMVACEEGILPFQRFSESLDLQGNMTLLEEERRLAFVGMTRAKERLELFHAHTRFRRGKTDVQASSRFVAEIGDSGVTREQLTTAAGGGGRSWGRGGFYGGRRKAEPVDAVDEDFADAAVPEIPPEYEYLRPGCSVYHQKFGVGTVKKLARGWPETRATIDFKQYGRKRLVLAVAGLELVDTQ